MVAVDVGRAGELVAALASAGRDLESAAQAARHHLHAVGEPSGAPALVEDVAAWTRRTGSELASRTEQVVHLDTVAVSRVGGLGAAGRPGVAAPAGGATDGEEGRFHLDVRGVGDLDHLFLQLAAVGVLDRCPLPGDVPGRARLFATLPADLVDGLTRQAPAAIGGADGVPFALRDRANRLLLAREIARLEGLGSTASVADRRLLRDLRTWQRDTDLMVVKLDAARGRVVLARGDLDRATHVAVLVPGAGLTIEELSRRHLGWLDGLHARMGDHGGPGRAGVVLWLDYDSPAQLVPQAVRRQAATDAATRLPAFLEGIAGVERELVTTLGHSYGSVVLGRSLADHPGRLATDQVVALGSPGMGVQLSRHLHLREDQRLYAATLAGDPIAHVGQWNPLVGEAGRAVHGPDPRRLGVARTIELSTHDLPDADPLQRHMQYLEEGSSALGVLAGLASGRTASGAPGRGRPGPPAPGHRVPAG